MKRKSRFWGRIGYTGYSRAVDQAFRGRISCAVSRFGIQEANAPTWQSPTLRLVDSSAAITEIPPSYPFRGNMIAGSTCLPYLTGSKSTPKRSVAGARSLRIGLVAAVRFVYMSLTSGIQRACTREMRKPYNVGGNYGGDFFQARKTNGCRYLY